MGAAAYGQRVTIALATGENADGLENIVFRKEKAAKQAAQLGWVERGAASNRSSSMRAWVSSALYWSCAK